MVELIAVEQNGGLVVGRILRRSPRFIEVELRVRSTSLATTTTVPLFAAAHLSLLGDEGDRCAVAMLARLHRQAQYVSAHRDELRVLWNHIDGRLFELAQTHPGASEMLMRVARVELKRILKQGGLSQSEYQSALRQLRLVRAEFESEREELLAAFMGPWSVGLEMVQVLRVLDSMEPAAEEGRL